MRLPKKTRLRAPDARQIGRTPRANISRASPALLRLGGGRCPSGPSTAELEVSREKHDREDQQEDASRRPSRSPIARMPPTSAAESHHEKHDQYYG
jgi:hypothetical protein